MSTIRFTSAINLTASGKQRRFQINAYSGGKLVVSGYQVPVIVDLNGLDTSNAVPILIDHRADVEATLGLTDRIENNGRSLVLGGPITGVSSLANQVLAQSNAGHTWQASIGASVIESENIAAGKTVNVNGQQFVGPVIVARRSILKETSVLPMGADSTTSVNLAAKAVTLKGSLSMTFEEFITSLGLNAATLTPEANAVLQTAFETMQTEDGAAAPATATASAVLDLRATAVSELNRQGQINAMCVGYPHIAATAISSGWSPMEAENHVLRAKARSMAPSNRVQASHSTGMTKNHLSAAILLRAGGENVAVKSFGADVCQQARDLRCTNLIDLAAHALTLSGQDKNAFQNNDQMLKAAFSTSSLPTILSDSVGKTLISAYEETTSDWRKFCHIGDAQDFKDQTGVRPAAIASLEQLGAGGKIKHGSLQEEDTYAWNVATFAKMLSVTRQTIVNDDLGFISELAPMLGTAAGRSLNDLIWSTILGGQTANFFSSGNANLATAASALAVGTLGAGVAAMRSQRDSQGFDIALQPVALVVPPALELTARALLNSNDLLGTSGVNGNPVKGIVENLIVEPRLSNSTRFSNTSDIQWYLFAAPMARAITVGFLRGAQNPTVETGDADFNTLGIQMRVFHDYGVALADPKAAYKAVGTAP
jgi:hypothetical protein